MYQVSAGWLLHDIPNALLEESKQITLRGYNEEFMRLSGDFAWDKPLSVDDVASDICPVRKDLYNDKARGLRGKQKDGKMTWGRLAGRIVEPFCTGLLGKFDALYTAGKKANYQSLLNEIESYSHEFFTSSSLQKKLQEMGKAAAEEGYNTPEHRNVSIGLVQLFSEFRVSFWAPPALRPSVD